MAQPTLQQNVKTKIEKELFNSSPNNLAVNEHLVIHKLKCIKQSGLNPNDPFGLPLLNIYDLETFGPLLYCISSFHCSISYYIPLLFQQNKENLVNIRWN